MKKNIFERITKKEVDLLFKTIKIIKVDLKANDHKNDDGENHILEMTYGGTQSFGATDYKDHRNDTKNNLIKKIIPSIYGGHQRGHFYDSKGDIVDTMYIKGYLGGYTGWFKYKSNKTAFGRMAN